MINVATRRVAAPALGLALACAPALVSATAAPASAASAASATVAAPVPHGHIPWGHISNHTGRTLIGVSIVSWNDYKKTAHPKGWDGRRTCTVWNWGEYTTKQVKSKYCFFDYIKPHTTTATFKDFDAVTVRSSGYYWVRFQEIYAKTGYVHTTKYRKVTAGHYTRFDGTRTAHCYSGRHVKCTVVAYR